MEDFKEDLFGKAGKIPATYNHVVPIDKLNRPLGKNEAIRVFCTACGTVFAFDLTRMLILWESLSEFYPKNIESFSGYYLHVGQCPLCDGDQIILELREIPKK